MRVLWLAWPDLYASRRIREASRGTSISIDVVAMTELAFHCDGTQMRIDHHGVNVVEAYDAACIRTLHPYISEALLVARLFYEAGKVVIDQALVDEGFSVSKMYDYLVLAGRGIPVPVTHQIFDRAEAIRTAASLGYPCVLKGTHGSQGLHVHKVTTEAQLLRRLAQYSDGELLLQEFIPAEEDYRVLVVGGEPLPVFVVRHPRPGDFRTNFAAEGEGSPRDASTAPEITNLAGEATRILRREIAGVDIRCRSGQPLVLEVNRRPDFDGFEAATGVDVATRIVGHIVGRLLADRPAVASPPEPRRRVEA